MNRSSRSNPVNGIMLAGWADNAEFALACAAALARHEVSIHCLVVGPRVPEDVAKTIANLFPVPPPIIVTSRPDKDLFILELLETHKIDLLFACFFEYRIRPKLLRGAISGGINTHPSALPHNGGFHGSFWSIYNGTPFGATIHWLSEDIDKGDIIGQAVFEDDGIMSSDEVVERQRALCVDLFEEYLPEILSGSAPRIPQPPGGSYHFKGDIESATSFDESDTISMDQLLRLARGTRRGSHGFYVQVGQRKFKVQASVSEVYP